MNVFLRVYFEELFYFYYHGFISIIGGVPRETYSEDLFSRVGFYFGFRMLWALYGGPLVNVLLSVNFVHCFFWLFL